MLSVRIKNKAIQPILFNNQQGALVIKDILKAIGTEEAKTKSTLTFAYKIPGIKTIFIRNAGRHPVGNPKRMIVVGAEALEDLLFRIRFHIPKSLTISEINDIIEQFRESESKALTRIQKIKTVSNKQKKSNPKNTKVEQGWEEFAVKNSVRKLEKEVEDLKKEVEKYKEASKVIDKLKQLLSAA
jgi:DNA-binding transcriptional MerR regulator